MAKTAGKNGWQKGSASEQRHNLLASHDHFRARIEQIRHQVSPPLRKPIYITEYNTYVQGNIKPSTLLDALHMVNWTAEAMYNDAIGGLMRWQTVTVDRKADNVGGYTLFVAETQRPDITQERRFWKMSSFYAAKLLAALHPTVVDVTVADHVGFKPRGFSIDSWTWWEGYNTNTRIGPEIPYLTAAATLSTNGKELALLLLNRNTVDGYNISLNLGNFTPNSEYTRIELDSVALGQGHRDIFDHNEYGAGAVERVALLESVDTFGGTIDIGAHQAVVIKLSAANQQPNKPPMSVPGVDQIVDEGVQVVLDGSASNDPDGRIVSYRWVQTDGPPVAITNSTSARATFKAPEVTGNAALVFELTVTDDQEAPNSASVTITVLDTTPPADPGIIAVLNGDFSRVPVVDFTDGQTTAQVSYGNPQGYPVRGVVEKWSGENGWRWVTAIDETAGETAVGTSPGWVDLGAQVFYFDGKLDSGRWSVPRNQTKQFRIRLKLKINGSWCCGVGDWLNFKIKR